MPAPLYGGHVQALPAFGEQLIRLAEVRGLDRRTLAERASLNETVITSALDGAAPSVAVLCRLAPVLGLHRSDLLLIAGRQIPDDLVPPDPNVRDKVGWLAWALMYLPRAATELHELVRSLPRSSGPVEPVVPAPRRHSYPNCPGGLVLRLLRNRCLDWGGIARYLYGVGGGPALSASTIGMIGHGRKALTPELLAGFGAVLDIAPADLAVLTGVDISAAGNRIHPDAGEIAELIWNARWLTAEQLRLVQDREHDIRHDRAEELDPLHRCPCPGRP